VEPAADTVQATSHFVDGKTLLLDGRLGHASVARNTAGGTAGTFVLATVTGADLAADDRIAPPPVHLAIVIDRSGSMEGVKMRNAVAAAVGAVERMHDGDRATVISFDDKARVLVPPTTIEPSTRPSVEASIRGMRAEGDTCISCALDVATATLDSSPGPRDEVRRILLISDGEPTTGVRDVRGLRALAAKARDRGFAVSTIGVDLAFDEKVMAAIAQESNGRHFFVPDPGALEQVFEQELGTLETALATDADLAIEPAQGVVVEDVLDRSFRREAGRIVVPLGAFDPRQEKTVLMKVRVPADADGSQPVVRLSLAYRDVVKRDDGRCAGELALDVRSDGSAQRDLDPFVAARVERNRTTRALTEANELFEKGHFAEARAELARRETELSKAKAPAVAAATALPAPARGFARPVDKDFGDQQEALAQAQSGFASTPAASAAPGAPPPQATPAAKSAVRSNQANATNLAF
jgi:Ca-activated chloride channel homolog